MIYGVNRPIPVLSYRFQLIFRLPLLWFFFGRPKLGGRGGQGREGGRAFCVLPLLESGGHRAQMVGGGDIEHTKRLFVTLGK